MRIDRLEGDLLWVHLGHGHGEEGLEDAEGRKISPERWIDSFRGRERRMAMALLLSCRSAQTARRLAEAGAGVTIGFEDDVVSNESRSLAAKVVAAALASGGNRAAILATFYTEQKGLTADGSGSRPIAFHPEL